MLLWQRNYKPPFYLFGEVSIREISSLICRWIAVFAAGPVAVMTRAKSSLEGWWYSLRAWFEYDCRRWYLCRFC